MSVCVCVCVCVCSCSEVASVSAVIAAAAPPPPRGRTAHTRRHEGRTNITFIILQYYRIIIKKFKSSGGARLQLAALLGEQLPPLLVDLRTRADSIINNLIM